MIAEQLRQAILVLKEQGRPLREISRALKVTRNTVRRVLREPQPPKATAEDPRIQAIAELLPDLYRDCKGNAVRLQGILKDTHRIDIPYSTLTRLIRERTDLRAPKKRSGTYRFGPGEEMQHDTSPHHLTLGGKKVKAQCASLILAYCRMLFIAYYPRFTRFEAKAFLTAALQFFDGSCPRCVIDNTSVILAGRTFADWANLNVQARAWCQEVANAKPKRVLSMSPHAAYAMEKAYLLPLPAYIPPVTEIHYRVVDCYGFVHLDTNRYSVPERWVGKKVAVHKRPEQVLVYADRKLLAERPQAPFRQLFLRVRAPMGPLRHTGVNVAFEGCVKRSGLKLTFTGIHCLRHSYALHLLRQGTPLKTIGDLLGHRTAESTCVYLRLAIEDLREVALDFPGSCAPSQEPEVRP